MRRGPDAPSRQELARRQRPRIISESAWSAAFFLHEDRVPHIGVTLQDGTYLFGRLFRFNPQIEETSDRSVVLASPISTRRATDDDLVSLDADTLVVSADQVQYMTVTYLPEALSALAR
ncbi:MAG: DUF6338 family protein [Gemmatimonadota bacterium]